MRLLMQVKSSKEFFITSYSAHTSLLDEIKQEGSIKKLYVDAGGLCVPYSAKEVEYLENYTPSVHKTLHAKVIWKRETDCDDLWLWTGNLREKTFDSQNILLSLPVYEKKCLTLIEKWFSKLPTDNIFFSSDGKSITKVDDSFLNGGQTIWNGLEKSIKNNIDPKQITEVHAFAPWGSKKFVEKLKNLFTEADISLYTRPAEADDFLWVDASPSEKRLRRYVSKEEFPHYKCIFALQGKKIVWCYIGSANFTDSAFFLKKNVEYALFFEKPKAYVDIEKLFDFLSAKSKWTKRLSLLKDNGKKIKDDQLQYSNEYSANENFKEREIAARIQDYFKSKKQQEKLDEAYRNGKPIKISCGIKKGKTQNISIKVLFIGQYVYKIDARGYEISIQRQLDCKCPLNLADEDRLFDSLVKDFPEGEGKKEKKKKREKEKNIIRNRNLRFPLKFAKDPANKKIILRWNNSLSKLKEDEIRKEDNLKLYKIWYPLLKRVVKENYG
jgi:hypothetical protein